LVALFLQLSPTLMLVTEEDAPPHPLRGSQRGQPGHPCPTPD